MCSSKGRRDRTVVRYAGEEARSIVLAGRRRRRRNRQSCSLVGCLGSHTDQDFAVEGSWAVDDENFPGGHTAADREEALRILLAAANSLAKEVQGEGRHILLVAAIDLAARIVLVHHTHADLTQNDQSGGHLRLDSLRHMTCRNV